MFTEETISKFSEYTCLFAGLTSYTIALIYFRNTGMSYFITSVTGSLVLFLYVVIRKDNQKKYSKKK